MPAISSLLRTTPGDGPYSCRRPYHSLHMRALHASAQSCISSTINRQGEQRYIEQRAAATHSTMKLTVSAPSKVTPSFRRPSHSLSMHSGWSPHFDHRTTNCALQALGETITAHLKLSDSGSAHTAPHTRADSLLNWAPTNMPTARAAQLHDLVALNITACETAHTSPTVTKPSGTAQGTAQVPLHVMARIRTSH